MSLINIPLSVSLAVASQSTPTSGIISAVWAGLMAAVLGGSQFNITGPTGALAGILSNYVLAFGFSALPLLSMTSAVIIGLLKWDKYMVHYWRSHPRSMSVRSPIALHLTFLLRLECVCVCVCVCIRLCQRYLPSSIVHGFTLGVGVIIARSQLSSALGIHDVTMRGSSLLNFVETVSRVGSMDAWAAIVCGASWLSLYFLSGCLGLSSSRQRASLGCRFTTRTHNIRKIEGIVLLSPFRS